MHQSPSRLLQSTPRNHVAFLQGAVAFLLWIYILYRAFTLSITQDEAYSYFLAKTDYWKAMPGSANTHWLNTLSMRLFLFLPGEDHPWKLRMLSVLSWHLYAYSAARLTTLFTNRWMGTAFFLIMMLNPFLLFFFSIGRGYAAACACITFSMWLASKRITKNDPAPRSWLPVFVWACLAVLCNFTSLYYLLGLCVVFAIFLSRQGAVNELWRRAARPVLHIVFATVCFSAASLVFIDLYSGDLEHGGQSNLPKSLFGSLLANSVYVKMPGALKTIAGLFITGILLCTGIHALYTLWKRKTFTLQTFFVLVLIMIVLMNLCFHLMFGIPYLLDRTTLIIFPLLTLFLFLFTEQLFKKMPRLVLIFVSGLIIFFSGLNFIKSFSLKYFKEWPVQQHSMKAYDFLQHINATNTAMDVWQYSVLHNYYRHAFPGRFTFNYALVNYRELTDSTGRAMKNFNYLVLSAPYTRKDNLLASWTVVMNEPGTGLTILKNPAGSDSLPTKISSSPK